MYRFAVRCYYYSSILKLVVGLKLLGVINNPVLGHCHSRWYTGQSFKTGTSLAVQVLAFENVHLKTWSRYLERLDEEFIERSGTWCFTQKCSWKLHVRDEIYFVYNIDTLDGRLLETENQPLSMVNRGWYFISESMFKF